MEIFKKCKVDGCDENANRKEGGRKDFCKKHYRKNLNCNRKCKVINCNNNFFSHDYCSKHYIQFKKYGKIIKRTSRDKNEYIDCNNYYEICLYSGKRGEQKEITRTKIDKEDYEKVKNYKWRFLRGYAQTNINKNSRRLHQIIMGKREGLEIDHIDGDKLNNIKNNLRFVTHQQNMMNQKSVKGYYFDKERKKWRGQIKINGKSIKLRRCNTIEKAIKERKNAELKYFGEFAFQHNMIK